MLYILISFSYTPSPLPFFFFFFNDTATTEIYTLSLHDALPIFRAHTEPGSRNAAAPPSIVRTALRHRSMRRGHLLGEVTPDRKSTRLNSSHLVISYAVFCLKKKTKKR